MPIRVGLLLKTKKAVLWFGTNKGLYRFNEEQFNFTNISKEQNTPDGWSSNVILTNQADRFGNIWLGTWYGGFMKYNPKTKTVKTYFNDDSYSPPEGLYFGNVKNSMIDDEDHLWVGSSDGLLKLHIPTDSITYFSHVEGDEQSLQNNYNTVLFQDSERSIWVGTSKGLNRYIPATGKFVRFPLMK